MTSWVKWMTVIKNNTRVLFKLTALMMHFNLFQSKMERKTSNSGSVSGAARKLSSDMQRKLSAISNCSDVSNLSVILGMDPNDFKSTIQNILGKLFDHIRDTT